MFLLLTLLYWLALSFKDVTVDGWYAAAGIVLTLGALAENGRAATKKAEAKAAAARTTTLRNSAKN